jgi:hypothetical protein
MSGNGDGQAPWSEDDLSDLDSALSFRARIGEIAVFLRREVEPVKRNAFERNWSNSAKLGLKAPNRPNSLRVDFEERPTASSEARKPPSAGARNPACLADPERRHQALEDSAPEAMLHGSAHDLEIIELHLSQTSISRKSLKGFKKKGCRQVGKVGSEFGRLYRAGPWRRP